MFLHVIPIFLLAVTSAFSKLHVDRQNIDQFSVTGKANICELFGGKELFDGATRCKCADGKTLTSSRDGGPVKCQDNGK